MVQSKVFNPLEHALVRFRNDRELLRHRLVLRRFDSGRYVITTPDRELKTISLAVGDIYEEIVEYNGSRLPAGVRAGDCYRDKNSPDGVYTVAEKGNLIVRAAGVVDRLAVGPAIAGAETPPPPGEAATAWHRAVGKKPPQGDRGRWT